MKYLCLVYGEESKIAAMDDDECMAYDAALRRSGTCVASEPLQPVQSATTLRVRNGRLSITDGPITESKEVLGGYWMIQVKSKQEAVDWARKVPAQDGDVIEIRQVFEMTDFPEDTRKAAENPAVESAIKSHQKG